MNISALKGKIMHIILTPDEVLDRSLFNNHDWCMMKFSLLSASGVCDELSVRIKRQRLSQNRTQAEFALMSGISVRTVKNLEKDGKCTLDTFIRCLMALGLIEELESVLSTKISSIAQMEAMEKPQRQRARKLIQIKGSR